MNAPANLDLVAPSAESKSPADLAIRVRDRRFGRDARQERWWLAGDGTVWRIGSEAHALVDRQGMLDELAEVQRSFRRL